MLRSHLQGVFRNCCAGHFFEELGTFNKHPGRRVDHDPETSGSLIRYSMGRWNGRMTSKLLGVSPQFRFRHRRLA